MRVRDDIGAECKRLVDEVRRRCPEAFDPDPLKPSSRGPDLAVSSRELTELIRLAARDGGDGRQLWRRNGDELLVDVGAIVLRLSEGLAHVTVPVECDQTGPVEVHVAFAVGSPERPAGMLAAAERIPRGPHVVVEAWADELTALVWRAFTEAVAALAADAGRDTDGAGLIPFAIEASRGGLTVRTIARHAFDRIRA